mmetsp:Transcript_25812/g.79413  ORF Transcript_25812/g.79413 Transcript_25812/m.79413 type:complete len:271 (-) Transcript_25812:58-870(-)
MPSLLGIESVTDAEDARWRRIRIEGIEKTDALGQVICQSSLRFVVLAEDQETPLCELALSVQLTPDTIEPIFSGAAWAGTVLWRAAVSLVEVLLEEDPSLGSVVEVGCGLGAPGMVCRTVLGADKVVLTEQRNLVELARRNADANGLTDVQALELDWSRQRARELRRRVFFQQENAFFDLVLCCDCVYVPLYGDSWKLLVETLDELAGPTSRVMVSVERRRVGGGGTDGVDLFLAAMAHAGFHRRTAASDPPLAVFDFSRPEPTTPRHSS